MFKGPFIVFVLLLSSAFGGYAAEDYLAEFSFDGDPGRFAELSVRPYLLTDDGFIGSVGANYAKRLAGRGIRFTVLDVDTEGKYYWVTEAPEIPGFVAAGKTSAGVTIFSTYDRKARPSPEAYAIGPIDVDFRALDRPGVPLKVEYNEEVAEIVNAVTEAELMGYDTDLVGFVTRYSYTDELKGVADYLEDNLASWGYNVNRDRYFGDNLSAVSAVDSDVVWAAGGAGAVFRTTDGGAFWSPVSFPTESDLYSVAAVAPGTVACGGKEGIIFSTADGGATWAELEVGGYVKAIRRSPIGYWAVNTHGSIYYSGDGLTWDEAANLGDQRLHDIAFDAVGNGVVVGSDGYIAYSDDGGANWNEVTSGVSDRISAVAFVDTGTVVAAGEGGFVSRSTNGGETWAIIDLATEKYFRAVAFPTLEVGYLAGNTGDFYVSDDGGITWALNNNAPYVTFEGITVAGPEEVWLAPTSGGALFFTDGADLWVDQAENADITSTSVWENVTAVLPGSGAADAVLLTAHYDSTSNDHVLSMTWAPGADDNATGVSTLLTAAHLMAGHAFASDVHFVFFSGEEQGLYGSSHYAPEVKYAGLPIKGVINVDSIGWLYEAPGDLSIVTNDVSLWLSAFYQSAATLYVPAVETIRTRDDSFQRSDHAPFWRRGYPALLIIEDFELELPGRVRNPYMNTEYDTIDKVNGPFFTKNAKAVVAAAASLAGPGGAGPAPDTLADVVVYPNPYRPGEGNAGLVFDGLPDGAAVELYNVVGEKVFEGAGPTAGILVIYPTSSASKALASGVYIYRISAPGGATVSGKLAVLK